MTPEDRIRDAIEALNMYVENEDGSYADMFRDIVQSLEEALYELEEE